MVFGTLYIVPILIEAGYKKQGYDLNGVWYPVYIFTMIVAA